MNLPKLTVVATFGGVARDLEYADSRWKRILIANFRYSPRTLTTQMCTSTVGADVGIWPFLFTQTTLCRYVMSTWQSLWRQTYPLAVRKSPKELQSAKVVDVDQRLALSREMLIHSVDGRLGRRLEVTSDCFEWSNCWILKITICKLTFCFCFDGHSRHACQLSLFEAPIHGHECV